MARPPGASSPARGRVLVTDGARALVRTAAGDVAIAAAPTWRAGDLVEITSSGARVERRFFGDEYPQPKHEASRLSRDRLRHLAARARALTALREHFLKQDFLEVETPLWVNVPGMEVALDPVAVGDGWLITSPELQMKRLLAAGLERIVQVCKCFRDEEDGPHHQREFTMVEWYRAWQDLPAIAEDVEQLVAAVCTAVTGAPIARVGERAISVAPPWPRLTVAEVTERFAGTRVVGDETTDELAAKVRAAGVSLPERTVAWDDIFYTLFVERVDAALAALPHPVLVTDWPMPLAALARQRPDGAPVVERFEAYVGGIELANAFGELTDAAVQRERFAQERAERGRRGKSVFGPDERFLAALHEGLPRCAGVALGFDRLVMLATGAGHIREVLAFASDEL